jgi:hypothetical protein
MISRNPVEGVAQEIVIKPGRSSGLITRKDVDCAGEDPLTTGIGSDRLTQIGSTISGSIVESKRYTKDTDKDSDKVTHKDTEISEEREIEQTIYD